ncbi:MAG: alpha/beta hydrolase [Verrucomicrobiales bacterium]|nr:alpha/beta hydrolase [Verrucomicrobiales bacterium]
MSYPMHRKYLIFIALCLAPLLPAASAEPPSSILLWADGAPGSEAFREVPEKTEEGKSNIYSVHHPSITPYLPDPGKATGTAVIVAPGGGHRVLCLGHEGYTLGQWLADHGIAAFVLKYRLAREEGSTYTIEDHAMADTRRAIRFIRSRAREWGIRPDRVGILGFSAGGELAAYAAMKSDPGKPDAPDPIERESSRPDFQGLIYPGKSDTFTVEAGMPPAFIAFGQKDRLDISRGMAEIYLKYHAAGVPAEMHIYSNAAHGFGYRPNTTGGSGDWPMRFREWLVDSQLLVEVKTEL